MRGAEEDGRGSAPWSERTVRPHTETAEGPEVFYADAEEHCRTLNGALL
jgi:hypothetical protein